MCSIEACNKIIRFSIIAHLVDLLYAKIQSYLVGGQIFGPANDKANFLARAQARFRPD